MKEKINTVLLLVVIALLVGIYVKPQPQLRPFQLVPESSTYLLIDMRNGHVCRTDDPASGISVGFCPDALNK